MNELIFLAHIAALVITLMLALRIGSHALVALICVLTVLMNLFVLKEIALFGFTVTCTDAFAVGDELGLNLLQEHFGKKIAQKTIFISFFVTIVTMLFGLFQTMYAPSATDVTHPYYAHLLTPMPRLVIVSLITYFIVMQADLMFYGWIRKRFSGGTSGEAFYIMVGNFLSIAATQLLDTVLFTIFGLSDQISEPMDVIVVSYAVKLIAIALTVPGAYFARKLILPQQKNNIVDIDEQSEQAVPD